MSEYDFERGKKNQKCHYVIQQIRSTHPKVADQLEEKLKKLSKEDSKKYYQLCIDIYNQTKDKKNTETKISPDFDSIPSLKKSTASKEKSPEAKNRPQGMSWLKFIREKAKLGSTGKEKKAETPKKKTTKKVTKKASTTKKPTTKKSTSKKKVAKKTVKKAEKKVAKKTAKKTTKKTAKKATKKVAKKAAKKKTSKKVAKKTSKKK